jgi:Ca-activated chloride channel family protein
MSALRDVVAVCFAGAICAAQSPTIHVDVHLITAGFSVRDSGGKLVTTLNQDDFEVFEDGVPQKISFFARSADVPLNLGLIVDVSGSQESFVRPHHKDLEAFLKNALAKEDSAFLLCFGNHLRLVNNYTFSAKEITESLRLFEKGKSEAPDLGPQERRILGTAFYDAIYYSISEKMKAVERGRRALIIFSDGEDNSSAHHMLDAIEEAQNNDVLLFTVRYTEVTHGRLNGRNKYGMSVMSRIARETGGADFDAREKGLAEDFRQIGEQLRSSYELAYHSTNPASDDSFHKMAIRVKQTGYTVRAKTGYYSR